LRKNIIFLFFLGAIIILGIFFIFHNFQNKTLQPPILLLSEEEWDFGMVKPNEKFTHIFAIKNEGDEELIIERVRSSCGCIKTSISTTRIRPGKSAELKATFDTTGYEGKIKKDIYIKSNDLREDEKRITLYVEVEHIPKPMISLSKDEWDLGLVHKGDIANFSFVIKNQGDANLIINKIETYEHIKYDINNPFEILPGEEHKLNLTYNSSEHKLGEIREAIRIYSNDVEKETLFIRIKGYIGEAINPALNIFPIGLQFNLSSDSEEGAIGRLTFENLGNTSIKIISIKSSADYLAPLRSEINIGSREKENLQVVLLKDKAREEIIVKEEKTEEYLYLTIALPIEITK